MKPLGRSYFKHKGLSKQDVHPPKGWINWWEDVVTPNKTREKRLAQNDIIKEIYDEYSDYQFEQMYLEEEFYENVLIHYYGY